MHLASRLRRPALVLLLLLCSACLSIASPPAAPAPARSTPPAPTLTTPSRLLQANRRFAATGKVQATRTHTPSASPRPPSPTSTALPEHRIGVRLVDGIGEVYDRLTGEKFVPRGFNYVRLAPMSSANSGLWHSTLNPGFYDPAQAQAALRQMHAGGYNVVRVFIDCCRPGSNAGDPQGGVSLAYLENVIDFLNNARANQIYVLMVLDLTPAEGGYDDLWQGCCTTFDGENLRYLTPGGHSSERHFDRDFIRTLIAQGAPMEAIFAFDLTNEVHFSVDRPPFSLASGKVITANQKTYDMGDPQDRQRMMDENLVYWIDRQRASILDVDPTALVTVSFPAINVGQTTVNPAPAILDSTADFVDLHTYLGWGLSLEQYMERFGMNGPVDKPVILGEFGAAKRAYLTAARAAQELQSWQAASCAFGLDGWLLWTWDTDEQRELWNGLSDHGEISATLAPKDHPDPCLPEEY